MVRIDAGSRAVYNKISVFFAKEGDCMQMPEILMYNLDNKKGSRLRLL